VQAEVITVAAPEQDVGITLEVAFREDHESELRQRRFVHPPARRQVGDPETDVVDDLVRRDWAGTDGTVYTLAADGEAALARISAEVEALRARALGGVDPAALETTRAVLARMAANLEELSPGVAGAGPGRE